jgi:hypothetical protein
MNIALAHYAHLGRDTGILHLCQNNTESVKRPSAAPQRSVEKRHLTITGMRSSAIEPHLIAPLWSAFQFWSTHTFKASYLGLLLASTVQVAGLACWEDQAHVTDRTCFRLTSNREWMPNLLLRSSISSVSSTPVPWLIDSSTSLAGTLSNISVLRLLSTESTSSL